MDELRNAVIELQNNQDKRIASELAMKDVINCNSSSLEKLINLTHSLKEKVLNLEKVIKNNKCIKVEDTIKSENEIVGKLSKTRMCLKEEKHKHLHNDI